ncbi:hypothetical protein KIW84_075090 [Lathyrus oleraceus]|uniref:Uncharacterized protein n=1 Tax=Pisum sativum TaxID=3888 RepID=A0A9D4ZYZ2_PEA|nr:hypothetical protein KIW84_075090 [Pisum sativum]
MFEAHVPWKSFGKEPVIVLIDRIFDLANPAPDTRTAKLGSPSSGNSWLSSLISTIIGNLRYKDSINNPDHGNSWLSSLISTIIGNLRYEDSINNPDHPFSSGVTLAKLDVVIMDEQGNETFDRLRKSVHLESLGELTRDGRISVHVNELRYLKMA